RDAVRPAQFRVYLRREIREGLLGGDGGVACLGPHTARRLRAVLHRRRTARHPGIGTVPDPGARAAASAVGRLTARHAIPDFFASSICGRVLTTPHNEALLRLC